MLCIRSCNSLWGSLFNENISEWFHCLIIICIYFMCCLCRNILYESHYLSFCFARFKWQKFLKCPKVVIYDLPGTEEWEQALRFFEFFSQSMARNLPSVAYCISQPLCTLSECGEGTAVPLLYHCTFNICTMKVSEGSQSWFGTVGL